MKPQRIQLSRKAGFNLQAVSQALNGLPAVNCARPSRWGNPHRVGWCPVCGVVHKQSEAVAEFRAEVTAATFEARLVREGVQEHMRGKNLGCYCKPEQPCHCDVLLEIANS